MLYWSYFQKKIQAKGGLCWGKDKRKRTNGGKDKRKRTNGIRTNGIRTREKQRKAEGERLRLYLRGIVSKTRPFPRAEQPMQGSFRRTRWGSWHSDFVAEHLFTASGVMYQLVSFFMLYWSYFQKKRYKLKVDCVGEKTNGEKQMREKTNGEEQMGEG